MQSINLALKNLYSSKKYIGVTILVSSFVFLLYFYLFTKNSSWDAIWAMNSPVYNTIQLTLSLINAILSGVSMAMLLYIFKNRQQTSNLNSLQTAGAIIFSAAATGCYVCGSVLLPTFGFAASLTSLPFGGLEVKVMTIVLLVYVIYEYSKSISGTCKISKSSFFKIKNGKLLIDTSKEAVLKLKPLFIMILFIVVLFALPKLPFKTDFTNHNISAADKALYSCSGDK